jgi:hypothetical protein
MSIVASRSPVLLWFTPATVPIISNHQAARLAQGCPPKLRGARQFGCAELRFEVKTFLTDPYPKMLDMDLSRSEIADIVAYIGGLDR